MKIKLALALGATIAIGAYLGFSLTTNRGLRDKLVRQATDAAKLTKEKVNRVSEDVAIKAARMTGNPRYNQDWVASQWESIGY